MEGTLTGGSDGGTAGQHPIAKLGALVIAAITWVGELTLLAGSSVLAFLRSRHRTQKLVRAIYELGVRTTAIVLIVGLFTGLVLGLQGYYTLVRFGSEGLLGPAVALSLVRELGPVLAALMIVGQAGSALSAELGIQRQSEQIDALSLAGIDPRGYLVGPRILAALFCFPVLTAIFDLAGIFGGYLSGVTLMGVDSGIFWNGVLNSVGPSDIWGGLLKATAFALISITVASCFGFFTHKLAQARGARGVNETTTRAVVWSCVLILAADYIITSFLV